MTITVNNVQLIVDEAMLASNDPDEVGAFAATYNLALGSAVSAITPAAATTDFSTTQVAAQDGFFTIGPNTTDLSFVASGGSPGVPPTNFPVGGTNGIDSGLKTTDGTSIYLFQSSQTNNVIYGAIGNNAANPAAFVLALDEQTSGGNVTNAKMWIVQYAAIQHHGQNLTEADTVDLLNKVFVASTSFTQSIFSDFSDVPAGSPIFAMIADDTNANPVDYLVTGFAQGAPGTAIQMNVSNQGSFPGSLATGSQNLGPGYGLRFDLVTDGVNTYTSSQSQSDTAIDFNTHQTVVQAGFSIVQNQGARPTDLKIELWDSLSNTADGHSFFTSVLNQASLSIDKILVGTINPATGVITPLWDSSNPAHASHFTVSGNAITVNDVLLNYEVEIVRAGGFDRFTATNVTTTVNNKGQVIPDTNATVDIGRLTFVSTQTSNDAQEVGSKILIDDSGPTIAITGTVGALDVDDSGLANGTNVGFGLTDTVNVAANFTHTNGSDGAGAVSYAMKVVNGTDSGLDDVATGDNILLRLNGSGVVEGYLSAHTTDVAFTVAVDSTGEVTLTHLRAIKHSPGGVDETASAIAANAVKVTGTITDNEGVATGDTASVDLPIGDKLNFHDDEPTISAQNPTINTLNVDDDTLGAPGADTIDASGLFTKAFGADGQDAVTPVSYALSTTNGPSGVFDVGSGLQVQLKTVSGVVHGYINQGGPDIDVFTVSVSGAGIVTLTQQRAIKHTDVPPASDNSDDPTNLVGTNLIKLTGTVTDKDGDTASAVSDLTGALQFNDGQPSITAGSVTPASLATDDDSLGATGAASTSIAASFTKNFGPDGAAASNDTTYAMTTSGGASGVVDVASGQSVLLKLDSGVVHGYINLGGPDIDVFTVSVNASGLTTLTQQRAIQHTDVAPASDNSPDPTGLSGSNKIGVQATVTDKDGDTKSATLDLTPAIQFTDGQPSISAQAAGANTLVADDDNLNTAIKHTYDTSFTKSFGPDGEAASNPTVYSLTTAGGNSGVFDTATGSQVQLELVNGVVHGYVVIGAVHVDVFTVSVNSSTAEVTLTQQRSLQHADTGTPTDASQDPFGLAGSLIGLKAVVTDKDGDTKEATANLTPAFQFNDGQPSITVAPSPGGSAATALHVTNTAGANATGAFGFDVGPDQPGQYGSGVSDFVDANANVAGVQLNLSGTVSGPPSAAISNTSVTLASEDANNAVFNFSFDYDKDPLTNGVQTGTATGTLTFDKAADTYTVAIANPVQGFSFNVLHTSELLAKQPVGNSGHPPIVVERLAVDNPNTSVDEDFYVQFTADTTPLGFSTTGDVAGSADKAFTGANHDLAGGVETWVSATQSTNGVAGDTIQKDELLSLRFFNTDILGDVATGTEKTDPTALASGIVMKFDGIGANEDLIVILDLKDPITNVEITRAVIVENADIYKLSNGGVPAPYNTEFTLDNNDGVVIIESNDYNGAGDHYQIQGVQIMQSPNGLTGQGINLIRAVGDNGGSSTTSNLQDFGGNTTDVLKIVDIGFVQSTSGTQDAHLDFSLQIRDADADLTTTQHLFVDFLSA
jgi:hypothetical protein